MCVIIVLLENGKYSTDEKFQIYRHNHLTSI